jgi:hypothetical protein
MGNVLFSLRAAHLQSGNVLIMEQWLLGGKISSKVVNIESEDHSEPAKKRPRRKYPEEYHWDLQVWGLNTIPCLSVCCALRFYQTRL